MSKLRTEKGTPYRSTNVSNSDGQRPDPAVELGTYRRTKPVDDGTAALSREPVRTVPATPRRKPAASIQEAWDQKLRDGLPIK